MANIPLNKGGIISTVLEGVLYGFSLFMFGVTLWVLFWKRSSKQVNRPMVTVACALFVFSTTHLCVDILRIIQGLIFEGPEFPGGSAAWFADVSQMTFVFKNSVYTLQTLLGDGVVIYRCYMVWRSFWVICFPCLMWVAVAVTAIGTVHSISQAADSTNIFAKATGNWVTAFYATTLATNFIATIILAYKIWKIDQNVAHVRKISSLRGVLHIVVDAGLLYSFTLFAALICFVNESNGQYIVLDMITPIISIAFYMVIIRVGLSKVRRSNGMNTTSLSERRTDPALKVSNQTYGMTPLEVHISQLTETDKEGEPVRGNSSVHKGQVGGRGIAKGDFTEEVEEL